MHKRVVITGVGPVTSIGIGKEDFLDSLFKHRMNSCPIPESFREFYPFHSGHYVPLPEFSLAEYGFPPLNQNVMQEEDRMAVLGAWLALRDAGFELKRQGKTFTLVDAPAWDIIVGTGLSSLENGFRSYFDHIMKDKALKKTLSKNARYKRMIIPMMMPNSVSAWISILFNTVGSSHTINASCASGTYALGEAYRRIKDGYADMVLAGGVECLKDEHGAIMRGFDTLGALTSNENGKPMPFSKERSGFLFAEGAACMLTVEELEHALARGATIYAEIVDFCACNDAHNIVQMDPSGQQVENLLVKLKGKRTVDYINTHGTGTMSNDAIEAEMIAKVFGEKASQPLINSTKGVLGHTVGASGALEGAITAVTIKESLVHGNETAAPIDSINLVTKTQAAQINCAITTSYGFGGHNCGIVLKKYNHK